MRDRGIDVDDREIGVLRLTGLTVRGEGETSVECVPDVRAIEGFNRGQGDCDRISQIIIAVSLS